MSPYAAAAIARLVRIVARLVLMLAVLALTPTAFAIDQYSVQAFNQHKDSLAGRQVVVEGRVLLIGNDHFRLRQCEVLFKLGPGVAPLRGKVTNVEVTGSLTEKRLFMVTKLTEKSNDLTRFFELRRGARTDSPEDWVKLAEWAKQRGTFYQDPELQARSEEAYLRAAELERRMARAANPLRLVELAEKSQAWGLPKRWSQLLLFESYALRFAQANLAEAANNGLSAVADGLARDLEGCDVVLKQVDPEFVAKFDKNPVDAYEAADDAQRPRFHRWLYRGMKKAVWQAKLLPDGSNGFELAEGIDRELPEEHDYAERLRDKALAYRASTVADLSRDALLKLAEQFRDRKQPEQSQQLIEAWLTLRRRRLPKGDAEGLIQLSDEYSNLLQASETARRLLFEAYALQPTSAELKSRIEKLGYRLKAGQWLTEREYLDRPEGQHEKALREGRIEPGMTGVMVRRAFGPPQSVSRSITAGQIAEVWLYGQPGGGRVTIHLIRGRLQPDLAVTSIQATSR